MRTKQFGLFLLSLFAVVLVMSAVSAAIVLNPTTQSLNVNTGSSGSFTFTIQNTDATSTYSNFTAVSSNLTSGSDVLALSNVVFGTLPTTLNSGVTSSAITVTINVPSSQAVGTYTGTLTIDADGSTTNPNPQTISLTAVVSAPSASIPSEITACTAMGNPGQLRVKKIDFTNNGLTSSTTFGKDDEWFPLENIDVQIDIKNDGNDDANNVEVSWGLWDTKNQEWVIDFDNEKDFDISDGKTKSLQVSFRIDDSDLDVDLSDLSDGNNYKLYVTAQGEVDNATAQDTCASDSEPASIIIESNFVVLSNIQSPETVQCGGSLDVTADVWNIGNDDQNDVSVEVFGREAVLDLDETVTIGDIDAFDSQPFMYSFKVPSNLENGKTYALKMEVNDEDGQVYENDFDDDLSDFVVPFTVSGCGAFGEGNGELAITANLVSGGMAGDDLVAKATIRNTGTEMNTYTIGASEYAGFASSVSLDQSTLVLNPGQSADVILTFDTNDDASGANTFFIEAVSGTDVIRQPVSVNIAPKSGIGSLRNLFSGSSWPIWGIALLNIILVIVIIIVAVRISRSNSGSKKNRE